MRSQARKRKGSCLRHPVSFKTNSFRIKHRQRFELYIFFIPNTTSNNYLVFHVNSTHQLLWHQRERKGLLCPKRNQMLIITWFPHKTLSSRKCAFVLFHTNRAISPAVVDYLEPLHVGRLTPLRPACVENVTILWFRKKNIFKSLLSPLGVSHQLQKERWKSGPPSPKRQK
jgi:hypothetical protein